MENGIKKKVMVNLIWRFGERVCAQFVAMLVSIVLARLLLPSDYGAISMVMIFITIANVFVDSGFGNALIQKKNTDSKDFSTVFYFNMVFSVLLYFLLFMIAPLISKFYKLEILTPVLRVLSLRLIIAGFNSVQVSYVQKNMLFKRFFWSTLGGTVGSGIVGIVMAYKGFGIWSLVAQNLFNACVDSLILWFTVKWRPTKEFSFKRLHSLFQYGWKILVWSLTSTLYDELRSLIIGKKYSKEDLAFYTKGKQWPSLIITNVNSSISSVLFPTLSKFQDEKERLKAMARRSISMSSYILAPMLMGMAALSTPIISLILTDKWIEAVPYMQICCFYLMFMPMQTANLEAIKAIGRSDIILKLEVIKKIVQISLLLISMHYGVLAIASSAIITTIFACFVNAWPNRKLLNYSYREQIKDLGPNLLNAIVMGIVVFIIVRFLDAICNDLIIIIIGTITGCVLYILFSVITHNSNFDYLLSIIKKRKNKI